MSYILTYWKDPREKNTEDDFDGIFEVRLKSVKLIPEFVAQRPKNCTMISIERSDPKTLKNGKISNYFKEVWRRGEPVPKLEIKACPLCRRAYESQN